jgi:hypothetical protein
MGGDKETSPAGLPRGWLEFNIPWGPLLGQPQLNKTPEGHCESSPQQHADGESGNPRNDFSGQTSRHTGMNVFVNIRRRFPKGSSIPGAGLTRRSACRTNCSR